MVYVVKVIVVEKETILVRISAAVEDFKIAEESANLHAIQSALVIGLEDSLKVAAAEHV